jgi:hypothetical protein
LALEHQTGDRALPSEWLRPAEGLWVLFHAYFSRTVPFDAEGTRISVAFDLMPVREA